MEVLRGPEKADALFKGTLEDRREGQRLADKYPLSEFAKRWNKLIEARVKEGTAALAEDREQFIVRHSKTDTVVNYPAKDQRQFVVQPVAYYTLPQIAAYLENPLFAEQGKRIFVADLLLGEYGNAPQIMFEELRQGEQYPRLRIIATAWKSPLVGWVFPPEAVTAIADCF